MSNRSTRVVEIDNLATQVSLEFVAKPENQITIVDEISVRPSMVSGECADADGLERKKTGVSMV